MDAGAYLLHQEDSSAIIGGLELSATTRSCFMWSSFENLNQSFQDLRKQRDIAYPVSEDLVNRHPGVWYTIIPTSKQR